MMGVDLFSGAFNVGPFSDLALQGAGPDLNFTRYYSSYNFGDFPMSTGWTHNHFNYIAEDIAGNVVAKWGNGAGSYFVKNIDGSYSGIWGTFDTLVRDVANDGYNLTTKDQTLFAFRRQTVSYNPGSQFIPDMMLYWVQDKNGNKLIYSYIAGTGLLNSVSKQLNGLTSNQSLTFQYTTLTGNISRLSQVTDNALGRTVYFTYNANGDLASYKDARGNTTTYSYNADRLLTTITYPEGNTVAATYDANQKALSSASGGVALGFDYTKAVSINKGII